MTSNETVNMKLVDDKLHLLIHSFEKSLYDDDETFMKNMKTKNLAGDDISRYRHWEWTQGVGLFGFWKYYETTGCEDMLSIIKNYYERQYKLGFPGKNINTTAPLLTLTYLIEKMPEERYMKVCNEWAEWLVNEAPKTKEGGLQHMTSDSLNDQELWDDTLFMAVLFLARMGKMTDNQLWIDEALKQFRVHIKYLADPKSGLWFHGWTFNGNNNFAEAFWGRGNSWVTMAIPEIIDILGERIDDETKKYFVEVLNKQISALEKYQDKSGMWHTLIDDKESYEEASATSGFGFGILMAVRMGLCETEYRSCALKALNPILDCIDDDGIVNRVSYGTPVGRINKEFYKEIEIKPMPYGQAMAILFLLEVIQTNIKEDVL